VPSFNFDWWVISLRHRGSTTVAHILFTPAHWRPGTFSFSVEKRRFLIIWPTMFLLQKAVSTNTWMSLLRTWGQITRFYVSSNGSWGVKILTVPLCTRRETGSGWSVNAGGAYRWLSYSWSLWVLIARPRWYPITHKRMNVRVKYQSRTRLAWSQIGRALTQQGRFLHSWNLRAVSSWGRGLRSTGS